MRHLASLLCVTALALGGCSAISDLFGDDPPARADTAPARAADPAPRAQPAPVATRTPRNAARTRPAAAAAPTGAFTTRPGAVYENSYGNTLTVTNVWGHHVEFRDQNGNEYLSYALLHTPSARLIGSEGVLQAIDGLWPLAEGKEASAWVYNAEWAWKLSWRVLGRETVRVPAGTFETWVVEHTEESLQAGFVGKSRSWYAPAVGWNVRYRSWQERPYSLKKPDEWELTAIPSRTTAAR